MKAEIRVGDGDELRVTLDTDDIPGGADLSTASLRQSLPSLAPGLTEAFLALLEAPQERDRPRTIRAITIQLVRRQVIGEVTVPLPDDRQVYA